MELLLKVNGTVWEISARPTARLIDVLRDQMGLTGTKEGCGEGECGACTVIVDGRAVNSCVMLAVQALGKEVLTVEGLAASGELDTLQQKFVEQGAVQCGFCTPGMLMSAKALLMANPLPSDQDIRTALAGNLCRCTGYKTIVAAVRAASGQETAAMEVPGREGRASRRPVSARPRRPAARLGRRRRSGARPGSSSFVPRRRRVTCRRRT